MKWKKQGLVSGVTGSQRWAKHSALTPTPLVVRDGEIRVYAGFRDDHGISRIGYVDVDATNPAQVLRVGVEPALDIGRPGAFDDHGVILGDLVWDRDLLYMFYVGFQLAENVKFLAFSGLAVSQDRGESFTRVRLTPILDRSDEGLYIRAIHSVVPGDSGWRIYYAAGSGWITLGNVAYPRYHIRQMVTSDFTALCGEGEVCIASTEHEYRIGRPRVWTEAGQYRMFYTKGDVAGNYVPGFAQSSDGRAWTRSDELVGLPLSATGWDSESICYLAPITVMNRTYVFYNGNRMGYDGFGWAELDEP